MARDESGAPESKHSEGDEPAEGPANEISTAETRVIDDDPALAETRVASIDESPEESDSSPRDLSPADAATVVADPISGDDSVAETVVTGAEDDDLTQVVARDASHPPSPATGEAAGVAAEADSDGPVPDTRVLEESDKTAPPRVAEPARPAVVDKTRRLDEKSASAGGGGGDRGLSPGTVLFGEYEIVNVLGVGGMGEVYRAKHRRLEEHRAIKVMHAELSKKKGASEFFYREAKALLAVRHPAVVHCHDLLSDDEGRVYLIMEMIEGIPLSKKMNDGPLSPDDVAILGARVAHGLSAAHRRGVIHRDVSPDNIVLPNGRVQEAKIIDFGIAKILQEGEGTIVDGFKGKLSYASPEQLGFFGGKLDGRSDFYSLGLVLVAAAQGRPMGMGTTVMEAVDARRSFQTLPDAIPIGLRSAIQPLLALDPDDRPKYVDRLFVVPGGVDVLTDPGSMGEARSPGRSGGPKQEPAGRKSALIGGVAAAIALAAGVGFYSFLGEGGTDGSTDSSAATPSATEREAQAIASPNSAATASGSEVGNTTGNTTGNSTGDTTGNGSKASGKVASAEQEAAKPPARRPLRASDRIKIIGLLSNARLALQENRLMSPASDNAYDRYKRVLALDPDNDRAKTGMREIAARYVSLADRAADKGDIDQARDYASRARKADSAYPGIARITERIGQ